MDVSLLTTAKRCSGDYYQEIIDNTKNKNNSLASVKNGRIADLFSGWLLVVLVA